MKKYGYWIAFAVGLYVLQASILPLIAYHGISPNLLMLLTVSFAFLHGARYGVLMGFCLGVLQDLATGTFFGVSVFSYMLLGIACGSFSNRVFKEQLFLPVLASIAATAVHYSILTGIMMLMGYSFNLGMHIRNIFFPMMVYQLVFVYPVHRLAYSLEQYIREKKS